MLIGGAIGVALATPSPSQTAIGGMWQEEKPCTFYVFTDGTNYYAQNCDTGAITYGSSGNNGGATGTSLSSVLNHAVAANELIAFGTGTFVIDAPLTYSVNNVVFRGAGDGTDFTEASGFNSIAITVSGRNWLITQIELDSTNQVKGNSFADLRLAGWNNTVSNSFFTNGDHGQIWLDGIGGSALNNVVTNSHDDGIIIQGNYNLVQGNTVSYTTNHNCISMVGKSTGNEVIDNTCKYSGSYGIAVENQNGGGNGSNYNVLISGNVVYKSAEEGIVFYEACTDLGTLGATTPSCPGTPPYVPAAVNSTISDNIVSYAASQCPPGSASTCLPSASTPGIGVYSGQQITVVGNQIIKPTDDGIALGNVSQIRVENNQITQAGANGIDFTSCAKTGCETTYPVFTTYASALVTGNTITWPNCSIGTCFGQNGIELAGTEPGIIVSSNTIVAFPSTHDGIAITGASDCVISSNSIAPETGYQSGTDGLYFTGTASNDCVVTSNSLYGGASGGSGGIAIYIDDGSTGLVISNNDVDSWATGIQGASTENYNSIVDNVIRTSVTTKVSVVGANDVVEGNMGYNPVAAATFTAGTSPYTYTNADHYTENVVLTTAGGISLLTCNGVAGWAITAGSTCTLWPGQTMVVTWSTTAPTFTKIDIS